MIMDRVGLFMLISYIFLFLLFLVLPLGALISKSLQNKDGEFIGLTNYNLYLQEPALFQSLYNSLFVAICSTVIVVVLAFLFSYALTRTCMPFKGFFKLVRELKEYKFDKIFINRDEAVVSLASVFNKEIKKTDNRSVGEVSLCLIDSDLPGEVEVLLGDSYPIHPEVCTTIRSLQGVISIEEY